MNKPIKEYELNKNLFDTFIQGWYIPYEICDNILNTFKTCYLENKTHLTDPPRNYFVNWLIDNSYDKNTQKSYIYHLNLCLQNYFNKYEYCGLNKHFLYKDINVQYFKPPNCFNIFHSEKTPKTSSIYRTLVFMTYLNNVFDKGETEFFYQKLKIKPKKGLTIIWPAEWTHTHKGISSNEDKYIVTGWFEYQPIQPELHLDITNFLSPEKKLYTINY